MKLKNVIKNMISGDVSKRPSLTVEMIRKELFETEEFLEVEEKEVIIQLIYSIHMLQLIFGCMSLKMREELWTDELEKGIYGEKELVLVLEYYRKLWECVPSQYNWSCDTLVLKTAENNIRLLEQLELRCR